LEFRLTLQDGRSEYETDFAVPLADVQQLTVGQILQRYFEPAVAVLLNQVQPPPVWRP
jgi:hypothetical protein